MHVVLDMLLEVQSNMFVLHHTEVVQNNMNNVHPVVYFHHIKCSFNVYLNISRAVLVLLGAVLFEVQSSISSELNWRLIQSAWSLI